MADQKEKREPHPTIPGLYRIPQRRTAGGDLWPWLQTEEQRRIKEKAEEEIRRKREGR
jgi:hypothetical protein